MISAKDYAAAHGGKSPSRVVKAQVYGAGKAHGNSDLTAAALARSEARPDAAAVRKGGYPAVSTPDSSPINNMGENYDDRCTVDAVELVMTDSGEIKQVMLRRPAEAEACVIDWLNFTVLEDTWFRTARETLVGNEEIIVEASRYLEKIFGFGITAKRDRGMNFYKESWVLGDEMGFVCFGGQRQTMLITLTGQGCLHALSGWEKRLHDFLTLHAIRPVITRVDLAHDDLEGAYLSVDWAEAQYHARGYQFAAGGTPPTVERVGNWHRPRGAGRTFTVGLRTSGKFTRFYEKGKKEGDRGSLWCRCEVEFKSSDRIIPLDVLLSPTEFFAAAYPCFASFVHHATPTRLQMKEKLAEVTVDSSVKVTKRQFGKYLRVFRDLWGDKATLDLVCNEDVNAWPKRLKTISSSVTTGALPVHHEARVLEFIKFIKAAPSFGLNGENCLAEAF